MKDRHDGDCSYYASPCNGRAKDGVCTCGYSHELIINGDYSQEVSAERIEFDRQLLAANAALREEVKALKETCEILSNPHLMAQIEASKKDVAAGRFRPASEVFDEIDEQIKGGDGANDS